MDDFNNLKQLIKEMNLALRRGDFTCLAELEPRIQNALHRVQSISDSGIVMEIQSLAREADLLLAACLRGLLAAQRRLAQHRTADTDFRIYDHSGRRARPATPAALVHKRV